MNSVEFADAELQEDKEFEEHLASINKDNKNIVITDGLDSTPPKQTKKRGRKKTVPEADVETPAPAPEKKKRKRQKSLIDQVKRAHKAQIARDVTETLEQARQVHGDATFVQISESIDIATKECQERMLSTRRIIRQTHRAAASARKAPEDPGTLKEAAQTIDVLTCVIESLRGDFEKLSQKYVDLSAQFLLSLRRMRNEYARPMQVSLVAPSEKESIVNEVRAANGSLAAISQTQYPRMALRVGNGSTTIAMSTKSDPTLLLTSVGPRRDYLAFSAARTRSSLGGSVTEQIVRRGVAQARAQRQRQELHSLVEERAFLDAESLLGDAGTIPLLE